jgi:hypothetical protein
LAGPITGYEPNRKSLFDNEEEVAKKMPKNKAELKESIITVWKNLHLQIFQTLSLSFKKGRCCSIGRKRIISIIK